MKSPLVLVIPLLFAAAPAWAKLNVVATTQDPAAIASAIGGERVAVTPLCKGHQDPHYLDAKPSFMLAINKADLVLAIGLDLEVAWLPPLLTGARNPKVLPGNPGYLDLSTLVVPLEVGGSADRAEGDVHPRGNPHYWLDPENGRALARGIAARLTQLDPEGATTFAANLKAFEATLDARSVQWAKAMAPLAGKPIIAFHKSWPYFAARYQLPIAGYVEPKPGVPPTAQHTVQVIQLALQQDVRVILMENFYDKRPAQQVANHSKAKVVAVPIMVAGDDRAKTYFDLLDVIVAEVSRAAAP